MGNPRIIFHVDMNAFFASVEMAEKPYLRGKPIVISRGDATTRTAICSTASYEARRFGVTSGMPLAQARRLCPALIPVEGHYELYEAYSARMMEYLRSITSVIEPASIDEAYLDVSSLYGRVSFPDLAGKIQQSLLAEQHLPSSIGIAPNKFLAKMASDMKKPLGITILRKRDIPVMLWGLPVDAMFGVGKKTAPRLHEAGFDTIGSLAPEEARPRLEALLGSSFAQYLHDRANGNDDEPVVDHTADMPQSIEREMTFERDIDNPEELKISIHGLLGTVVHRLDDEGLDASVVGVILKDNAFQRMTRQRILDSPTHEERSLRETVDDLFDEAFRSDRPVRLAGAFVSRLTSRHSAPEELNVFSDYDALEKKEALKHLLDDINASYGTAVIRRGTGDARKQKEK